MIFFRVEDFNGLTFVHTSTFINSMPLAHFSAHEGKESSQESAVVLSLSVQKASIRFAYPPMGCGEKHGPCKINL